QTILNGVESATKYNDQVPADFPIEQMQVLTWVEGLRFYEIWTGNLDRFLAPDKINLDTARTTFPNLSDEQIMARSAFREEFQDTKVHHIITRLN
ncbi:MAG TPA: hypothetical protein PLZ51_22450, partial [Aggregatilineales bacterium]|nr:hypothetical protein [Aggregatilineales bacterium]